LGYTAPCNYRNEQQEEVFHGKAYGYSYNGG
jgi:hypothetical protein